MWLRNGDDLDGLMSSTEVWDQYTDSDQKAWAVLVVVDLTK